MMGTTARDRGFTLLEVLVAFAIAAPALALLYRQGVTSMGITRTAFSYQDALSRARSHLNALKDGALVAGERSGEDGAGFRWRTQVTPIGFVPPPRQQPPNSAYAGGTTLFAVKVDISWPGPSAPRTVTLESRRLGPAVASPP